MKRRRLQQGFTLLELLVVIAIIGVLIALLIPAVQKVRASADRTHCANHLRQMGVALHNYESAGHRLPPGCSYQGGADPFPLMSWMTRILPYLEQESLWGEAISAFAQDKWFENAPHKPILSQVLPIFTCPSDTRTLEPWVFTEFQLQVGLTSYLGMEGRDQIRKDGVLFVDSHIKFAEITDGLSNTLMVGERPPSADGHLGWWYAGSGQSYDGSADTVLGVRELNIDVAGCPAGPSSYGPGQLDNQCDCLHYWSLHPGGANFLFCDGSVHFIGYDAAPLMPALATRNGREPVSLPD